MVRHFVKTFVAFMGMIIFGLVGVYLINYFDKINEAKTAAETETGVAK